MNPDVIKILEKGARVVTATNRLAYELRDYFDQYQGAQGKKVWQSADVVTWDAWLLSLWERPNSQHPTLCLNVAQCQHLFAKIIQADVSRNDELTAGLFNAKATAKIALNAWQLCHQWHISYRELRHAEHPDHVRFGQWAIQFHAELQKHQWLSHTQLPDALRHRGVELDKPTYLFGFEQLTSQQRTFIAYFKNQRMTVNLIATTSNQQKKLSRYAFVDERSQWQAVAAWARENIDQSPDIRLGIICPDVRPIRNLASECLREQLTPQFFETPISAPFHFSAGVVLAKVPLIQSALDILALLNPMDFSQCKVCLMSQFWGSEVQQSIRKQVVVQLGKRLPYRFDLLTLVNTLTTLSRDKQNQDLIEPLKRLQAIKEKHRKQFSLTAWREVFQTCLGELNWPAAPLNSDEFQALEAWNRCLDEWVRLDTVCAPMDFNQSLSSLSRHVSRIQFQAQAMLDMPVQVVGAQEAAELHFDKVWLIGFDEQAWPPAMQTNPFVPIQAQAHAGIPEANAHSFASFYQQKTQALLMMSDQVIVSHAQTKEDLSLNISPLFSDIERQQENLLAIPISIKDIIRNATAQLQLRQDDIGSPFSSNQIRGGTGVVRDQALCPFKAYAHYRLIAQEIEEPELGLNALDLGIVLHEILAVIWTEIPNSKQLHEHINHQTLEALLIRCINKVLRQSTQRTSFADGFELAQSSRLLQLLLQWMALEAERNSFHVLETERQMEFMINGMCIKLTLDRLDEVRTSNGDKSLAIIDYKSGKCELNHWSGERLLQPQIPLYYLALSSIESRPINALAFAQVKQQDCQFIGLSAFEGMLPKVKVVEQLSSSSNLKKQIDAWDDLAPTWRQHIEHLVADFQRGNASVDPLPNACTYCDYGPLCRISSEVDA